MPALLEIPAHIDRTVLSVLLERARQVIRIWAEQSRFELKLKRHSYRWSDGADGRPRSWYVDVDEAGRTAEIEDLQRNVHQRELQVRTQVLTAFDRFSITA
ncbi:hypothetical protein [Bradyrhizobium ivorense]|uniref:hypothetical protein n=1 Tax=Bradyrhizobium ivorense TaxID=2511166 RepID=UPI001FCEAADB|nr:hypothetical protein [Bradyrhizobium ivorense]